MKRKTFDVATLKEKVNKFLCESKDEQIAQREAQASLLDSILFETGNYKGFYYLDSCKNKSGFWGGDCRINFI